MTIIQATEHLIPAHALTVLVSIANPDTALDLLNLGASLVHPEEGRLIALFVSLGATEADARLVDRIDPLIERLKADHHTAELKVHVSTSVPRGILDVAREESADLVALGIPRPAHHHNRFSRALGEMTSLVTRRGPKRPAQNLSLGGIVESVVAVTPCDVLIYQAASQNPYKRVIVPVDGSLHASVACQIGILIGESFKIPVEAMYVQASYEPEWRGRGRIEQTLARLPGQETVTRTLFTAHDAPAGVLARTGPDDLIIIGVSEHATIQRWLGTKFSGQILRESAGPVILLRRSAARPVRQGPLDRFTDRLMLRLTEAEQDEILWLAEEMASPTLDYLVLMVVSAILASLGLLQNSQAVVIGAMLVAPLMQPLMGMSIGGAMGRPRVVLQGLFTLIQGVVIAIMMSSVIGMIVLGHPPTAEMLARGSVGPLDVGVALASGFVGAYATARKNIPGVLAGVAIAAALVPPLCTSGLSLGSGDLVLSMKASLLFLVNIVGISLSGMLVFIWLGLRPRSKEKAS